MSSTTDKVENRGHADKQRSPEERVGRCRHADEAQRLPLVEVEFGEAQGGECRHDIGKKREDAAAGLKHRRQVCRREMEKNHCRGRHSEGDDIGKRVELFAYRRRHFQQTCRHAVEEIKRSPYNDKEQGQRRPALKGEAGGDAA